MGWEGIVDRVMYWTANLKGANFGEAATERTGATTVRRIMGDQNDGNILAGER